MQPWCLLFCCSNCVFAVTDLSGVPLARVPYGPKFSRFHAFFSKVWQNSMLDFPEGWRPPRRESWIRPCFVLLFSGYGSLLGAGF